VLTFLSAARRSLARPRWAPPLASARRRRQLAERAQAPHNRRREHRRRPHPRSSAHVQPQRNGRGPGLDATRSQDSVPQRHPRPLRRDRRVTDWLNEAERLARSPNRAARKHNGSSLGEFRPPQPTVKTASLGQDAPPPFRPLLDEMRGAPVRVGRPGPSKETRPCRPQHPLASSVRRSRTGRSSCRQVSESSSTTPA